VALTRCWRFQNKSSANACAPPKFYKTRLARSLARKAQADLTRWKILVALTRCRRFQNKSNADACAPPKFYKTRLARSLARMVCEKQIALARNAQANLTRWKILVALTRCGRFQNKSSANACAPPKFYKTRLARSLARMEELGGFAPPLPYGFQKLRFIRNGNRPTKKAGFWGAFQFQRTMRLFLASLMRILGSKERSEGTTLGA